MGCCATPGSDQFNKQLYCQKMKDAIDLGDCNKVSILTKVRTNSLIKSQIDEEMLTINNKHLNALAYCIHSGNTKMFKHLLSLGADLEEMNKMFETQGMRVINLLCFKNFNELLVFYLPMYLLKRPAADQSFEYPIHSACKSGALSVIKALQSFFQFKEVPFEFSLQSMNDKGENSALIACRYGNLNVVTYLREVCLMSFKDVNKKGENALLVAIDGYKKTPKLEYVDLVVYLVDEVEIDITYMYKDLMERVDNKEISDFLEGKLEKKGIYWKRKEQTPGSYSFIEVIMNDNSEKLAGSEDENLDIGRKDFSKSKTCMYRPSIIDEIDGFRMIS